ncbi:MAG: YncE family protein [Armatimonadota bacterium]|nr:YncE family protein [Armatimonadota bacterium]MDR7403155.1 YncE family protein [Armatimonadota bacterium]
MRHLVAGALAALLCFATTGATAGAPTARAFITSSGSSQVAVIDATTYGVSLVELGLMTHGVAVDPHGMRAYITTANGSKSAVYAVDVSSGRVVGSFDLTTLQFPGSSPFGIAVDSEGKRVYVTHAVRGRFGAVTVLNVSDSGGLSLVSTVEVLGTATGVVVSPYDKRVYVANGVGRVSVIDPALVDTGKSPLVGTVWVGTALTGIAASPNRSRIYVADTGGGMLWVVDTSRIGGESDPVLGGIPVGKAPFGVAVSADGKRIAVANSGDNTVSLIDGTTVPQGPDVTVKVGTGPHGVSFTSDGSRVFVANRFGDSVTVISSATGAFLREITLPRDTFPVAFGNFISPGLRTLTVQVDVKPGGNPNVINLKSRGTTPVAILGSTGYDVTQVNIGTVRLAGAPVARKPNGAYMDSFDDVNGDGLIDLVLHFETAQMKLSPGDTQVTLEGEMTDGTPFSGTDSVKVVP